MRCPRCTTRSPSTASSRQNRASLGGRRGPARPPQRRHALFFYNFGSSSPNAPPLPGARRPQPTGAGTAPRRDAMDAAPRPEAGERRQRQGETGACRGRQPGKPPPHAGIVAGGGCRGAARRPARRIPRGGPGALPPPPPTSPRPRAAAAAGVPDSSHGPGKPGLPARGGLAKCERGRRGLCTPAPARKARQE